MNWLPAITSKPPPFRHEIGQPLQMLLAELGMPRIDIPEDDHVVLVEQVLALRGKRLDGRAIFLRVIRVSVGEQHF